MSENLQKKVFISYSWTTPKHEMWVLELAERLISNGVEVILDKWDLSEGQDKYEFMEKMVQDKSIDKVLIICEKGYKEKANDRLGGVGTETQIITPMLYGKALETKFIPIIAQKGDVEFDEYLPHYLKSRIGVVMACEESYHSGFEQLLRAIYDKPMFKKPKLGKIPAFLQEESKVTSNLHFVNDALKKYINDNRVGMIEHSINDFKEKFFEELDNFILDSENLKEPYDDHIISLIDETKGIRDEYLSFIESLICGYEKFDAEIIIEIFEVLYSYSEYKGKGSSYKTCIADHFKFLITELFIWTNILLLKYKRYKVISEILHTKYFVKSKFSKESIYYSDLRFYVESLEFRNSRLKLNRLCINADKLVERAEYNGKNYKELLIDIDLILYFVSKSMFAKMYEWYPTTYIYKDRYSSIDCMAKMVRKKHFEEIKVIFNINTVEEMQQLIKDKLSNQERGLPNSFGYIPNITGSVNIEEIGTI